MSEGRERGIRAQSERGREPSLATATGEDEAGAPGPRGRERASMSVRMTPDEAWARIDSAHTGIITSLRRDGMPIALPMWFCVVDGAVHFRTLVRSKKAARLRHDPRISFLVEGGERWAELWAVHLAGTAVFVDDAETHEKVQAALTAKYSAFRTDRSKMAGDTRSHYEQDHVFVRIDAEERIVSWENAKLGLA